MSARRDPAVEKAAKASAAAAATEDVVADSWESADLDERLSRLLLSSRERSSPELPAEEDVPPVVDVGAGGGGVVDEAIERVDPFLREALEKPRERISVLRMERDIVKFIQDRTRLKLELEDIPTSYLRLAAHRLAQHYGLQSLAVADSSLPDGSGSCVLLTKTSVNCQLPAVCLADIPVNLPQEDSTFGASKVAIKQRPRDNFQNTSRSNSHVSKMNRQRSVEERKEEYNRARARIFSGSSGNTTGVVDNKPVGRASPSTSHHRLSPVEVELKPDISIPYKQPQTSMGRGLPMSTGGTMSSMAKADDPVVVRQRAGSRVAIFRDREMDKKDPDYDRSYGRYVQRFDPGFGFNNGAYGVQPLYAPVVNYNTEFPQLGSAHNPQASVDQSPQSMSQRMHGPWSAPSGPVTVTYQTMDGMLGQFTPGHVGGPIRAPMFVPQPYPYPIPSGPRLPYPQQQEPLQPFPQTHHQQHPDASYGLARPR